MTGFSLRPYQRDAVARVIAARRAGLRRMVVCLPTGAGKTVIFSELARIARRPVLVLAHRRELVDQARDKVARALPDTAVVAVEQAAERAAEDARVVVASIRSLREERLARLMAERDFGLVVYDECHHAPAEDNLRVLRALGAFDDGWAGTLLGFTATPARADGLGLDEVFERIVYQRTLSEMIRDGYLAPLRGYRIATAADLDRVTAGRNDFVLDELAEAVDVESRNALVARSIQELARDRRTLVFCVNVRHARHLARALNAVGVPTGIVHGAMKKDRRAETLRDFRLGRLAAVTNVGVLTEGFDDPGVSCVAMARPTRSDGLYAQCVGRGTRLAPGKTDCLVLDFVDLSERSLTTLPSLAGLPRDLSLDGARRDEAERSLAQIWDDHPGFEVEPGSITLDEIERRAAAFNPLTLDVDPEISAVSANCWESLGSAGLALHVHWGRAALKRGRLSEILVLDTQGARRGSRRWRVLVDGKEMARFSRMEEAVEAVDHEVARRGVTASARPGAAWRREPVPPALREQLAAVGGSVTRHGDALQRLAYASFGPRRSLSRPRSRS
ncbi:MAG: DEAD/DEAH box helicase [Myxococcales bacterium]|nr:DEAD/DEAH box helicase [Myxococcales bacterium]